MRKLRIRSIAIDLAQRGWVCSVWVGVMTRRQSSFEYHEVESSGRWWFSALFNGWRAALAEAKRLQTLPGGHNVEVLGS